MTYLTLEQSIRFALGRKRRMRLIYKWRHGLERTHQPATATGANSGSWRRILWLSASLAR